jgi:glycosyltransferase involved in cell wall biosynthesis
MIVHSRYVEERARALGYTGPAWIVPHPAWPAPRVAPERIEGGPVIGCFGHVNASKRVPQLLDAFAQLLRTHPRAKLLFIGPLAPRYELSGRIEKLALGDALIREEYVPEERLWSLMAAADIHVCLRAPTMGETSGSALRALSLGKPLVVSDLGWFAELPDGVALKVAVDEHETRTLAGALVLLADDAAARRSMGDAARALAEGEHAVSRVADLYAEAIEQASGGGAVRDAVLGEVARAAADVGISVDSAETAELATRLGEVGLGR